MKRMILAALLALPLTAQADIIKCVNEAGQVAYQDSRCPPGAEETVLKIRGGRLGPAASVSHYSAPESLRQRSPEASQGDMLIVTRHLKSLRELAEQCEVAMNTSRGTISCLDMQSRFELLLPEFRRFSQMVVQTNKSSIMEDMAAEGLSDIEFANSVYQRLNREYYGN